MAKTHLPPMPWSYETNAPVGQHEGKGFVYLLDADGRKIGTVWGKPDEKLAVIEFICDAAAAKAMTDETELNRKQTAQTGSVG
jgi:hypothetical protein